MRCTLILAATTFARNLRTGDVDLATRHTGDVWIPVSEAGRETFYYNPVAGRSARALPHGAVAVALQIHSRNFTGRPGEQLVPDHHRKSCVPHCAWSCEQSICEQTCHPECGVPACETRCPKTSSPKAFQGCKVKCGEPNCAMFCPPDPCEGKKSLDCETPKCTTRCEEPQCMLDCGNSDMGCKTVCPSPQCSWKCQKPKECPKPKCSMKCEMAPECTKTSVAAPATMDGMETVGPVRAAVMAENHWVISEWGKCSSQCGSGTQTRSVECNAGKDHYCPGPKAATSQPCKAVTACEYQLSPWSACSSKCGQGTKQREVVCEGPECLGAKPPSQAVCHGRGQTCTECHMTVWGGEEFSGWQHSFRPGNYSGVELEYNGLKCDDVSSVEIVGEFCEATVYEFGDFNRLHPGWSTKLTQGRYTADDLILKGAKNNDISSFRLVKTYQEKPVVKHEQNKTATITMAPMPTPPAWRSGSCQAGVAAVLVLAAVVV
mmetsp:Transcript_52050/g.114234  ORF Transcript_52050/g.114234 Transcript_52050/m.114234 type:complete len:490 (+) Transcript_52050:94-1563(+)